MSLVSWRLPQEGDTMKVWDRLVERLERASRWSQLRALGNSNMVRASVLMPAFGYMLLLNDNVHQYLTIKFDGWLLNYLPSIWRVWLLFYGSFFLATATIVYSFFCSNDIKRYVSPYELADAQTQHILRLNRFSQVVSTAQELHNAMSRWERSLVDLEPVDFSWKPPGVEEALRQTSIALVHIWTIENIKHPPLRMSLYIMFAVGLSLLTIPAAFTFLQVTLLLGSRLTS
jgi:hypothetical protein